MISDTALAMSTREALHDLRHLQAEAWSRMAALKKIEAALPTMTVAERSAYVDELVEFSRGVLNGCMEIVRSSIFAAEQTQQQQVITQEIERALRPWTP